jgi:hypothetical protein
MYSDEKRTRYIRIRRPYAFREFNRMYGIGRKDKYDQKSREVAGFNKCRQFNTDFGEGMLIGFNHLVNKETR